MIENKKILAIDFNNVFFASYYSQKLYNSKGMNVNAIKGFFMKLQNLKAMFDPDFIVIASDVSRQSTFRRKMYPEYKGTRKSHDSDITEQMKYAHQMMALLGLPVLNNELYEADDILGMVSKLGEKLGYDTIIVSSDRDLYQLISEHTCIYSFRQNEIIDLEYMRNNYKLTPNQWIEYKMLQGDRSDNIPGVEGIGPKMALQLMQTFGSIDNLYMNIEFLSKNLKARLLKARNNLNFVRKLVTIITDYTILDINEKSLYRNSPYPDELFQLINDIEVYSLINVMKFSLLPQLNDKSSVYIIDKSLT